MPSLHPKTLAKNLIKHWKILEGDLVQIITGPESGKQGVVKKVLRKKNRLIVEGCNLVKRHIKKRAESPGTVITKEGSIHYSNVMLVCPKTKYVSNMQMLYILLFFVTYTYFPQCSHKSGNEVLGGWHQS